MRLNANFGQRVLLHADEIPWAPSPMKGVSRRPLERIGEEVARATTIVRYEPRSSFSEHTHDGGEEFIVLEGVFSDEHGDFPAGSYVRNPPTTHHSPRSEPGATIFVKLWQFRPDDRTEVRLTMDDVASRADPSREGVEVATLFADGEERVVLERWAANASARYEVPGGAELLLLEGSGSEAGDPLRRYSWVRVPPSGTVDFAAGPDGAKVWVKTVHLASVRGAEIA